MAESDLIRGNVDTVILRVLYEGDRYGYDLIKQINARSGGAWEIKQPTVYACLKRLEKQEFVRSYWDSAESDGGRRKYYSLTESGREVFLRYKSEFERANELFDGLISTDDLTFMPIGDDYADVEEDSYSVPKRRPARRAKRQRAQKPEKPTVAPTPDPATADTYSYSSAYSESTQFTEPERQANDYAAATNERPEKNDAIFLPPLNDEDERQSYAQSEFNPKNLFDFIEETPAPQPQAQEQADRRESDDVAARMRTAIEPRSIIDSYYASERGESYSDVHNSVFYTEAAVPTAAPTRAPEKKPSAPPAVAQTTAVAPVKPASVAPTAATNGYEEQTESEARIHYRMILSDLVDKYEIAAPDMRPDYASPPDEQAASAAALQDDEYSDEDERQSTEFGDEVYTRKHTDTAKEYLQKYYYRSNKLLLKHYTVMCISMFLVAMIMFAAFYFSGLRMRYDYLLFIGAGLLPIVMSLIVVGIFAANPNKKKRVVTNFGFHIFIRCIIMIQIAVVVYCLNLIWGMPIGFSAEYAPSLVIPMVYAMFIPISEIIFMTLLKSERYAVE